MYVVWFTAMSMDGRIAGPGSSLDFLESIQDDQAGPEEFAAFLATFDAVVIGGSTMRWLLDNGHGWPHRDLPTWLVSHDASLLEGIGVTDAPVTRVEGDLAPVFEAMEAQGHQRVWLAGGGDVAGQALVLDRVDEVLVTVAPTVLGRGPSLFDGDLPERQFRVEEARVAGNAVRVRWLRR
jgi:riboflavin biosynthesis pyrimidine reductase